MKADVEALFAALGPEAAPTFVAASASGAASRAAAHAIESRGRVVGFIGELHPHWVQRYELPSAPIVFEVVADALSTRRCRPSSRCRASRRWCATSRWSSMRRCRSRRREGPRCALGDARRAITTVRDVKLFDQYRGKGLNENEKSLAFRFWLQDTRQTLDEKTIEAAMAKIVADLGQSVGARLRS